MDFLRLWISGCLVSFGWLARGQFGHEWGAAVCGGAAAAACAFGRKEKIWQESFAQSVFWSVSGFALGGGFSFGKLVGQITAAPDLLSVLPELFQVFWIGGTWGGLGMLFLGFGLSGKGKFQDYLLFASSALSVWAVNNLTDFSNVTTLMIAFLIFLGLVIYCHTARSDFLSSSFGGIGFMGFGGAFLISVLALYFGEKEKLPGTWWQLSDMIWGFLGGLSTYGAAAFANRKNWLPRIHSSRALQRAGLIVYVSVIPWLNLWNIYQKWFLSTPPAPNPQIAGTLLAAGVLLSGGAAVYLLLMHETNFSLRILRTLLISTLFYSLLGILAVSKSIVHSGWSAWEPGFTVIFIENVLLTLALPILIRPPVKR